MEIINGLTEMVTQKDNSINQEILSIDGKPSCGSKRKDTDVKGSVVTWDALNTQKSTVEEVLEELKRNENNYKKIQEKEHSAIVTREYYLTTDINWLHDKNTTMSKTGAKNLQIMKKIALTILKTVQTFYKVSLKMLRYILSLDFESEITNLFKLLDVDGLKSALIK